MGIEVDNTGAPYVDGTGAPYDCDECPCGDCCSIYSTNPDTQSVDYNYCDPSGEGCFCSCGCQPDGSGPGQVYINQEVPDSVQNFTNPTGKDCSCCFIGGADDAIMVNGTIYQGGSFKCAAGESVSISVYNEFAPCTGGAGTLYFCPVDSDP